MCAELQHCAGEGPFLAVWLWGSRPSEHEQGLHPARRPPRKYHILAVFHDNNLIRSVRLMWSLSSRASPTYAGRAASFASRMVLRGEGSLFVLLRHIASLRFECRAACPERSRGAVFSAASCLRRKFAGRFLGGRSFSSDIKPRFQMGLQRLRFDPPQMSPTVNPVGKGSSSSST